MVRVNLGRRQALALVALVSLVSAASAASTVYGATKGPAVGGFDVVSYFTEGVPQAGDARYTHDWNGATWRFTSVAHRDLFAAEPERYAPQYGGYCSFAMSNDEFAPGDAKRWRIVDDKLYLNANLIALKLWERNIPGRVQDADGYWPAKRRELEAAP